MSFPQYPNPARRARIFQAHQLRQQGLTLRQIGEIMNCAPSTVAGYLRDYELFRNDLMRELAADQIVSHLIHLADTDDPNHDQRLADVRELRLLLASLPEMRRDENERARELNQGGVVVDQYGNRHPMPDRLYAPTTEEEQHIQQLPNNTNKITPAGRPSPDVPLAFIPATEDRRPLPLGEVSRSDGGGGIQHSPDTPLPAPTQEPALLPQPTPDALVPAPARELAPLPRPEQSDQNQTKPNKSEQESAPNPAQDSKSADSDQNSLPPSVQQTLDDIDQQLSELLSYRDWLNDYPPHNPYHPQRQQALRLVERRDALLAQANQSDVA